ncbi:MAG: flavodoxin domain-containing protein [Nanoarchaeota archaeon]|nr:flavodoxin domain-containing protein [Nanoarchaeota archaeon]
MKTLIIFYSRSGNTLGIAEDIKKNIKSDIEEITDLKNRNGIFGYLSGCLDAALKRLTKISLVTKDPGKYDLIIIGTPVWSGSMAPATRTFMIENYIKLKNTAFFCTMGGKDPKKTFFQMENIFGRKPKDVLAISGEELRTDSYKDKLNAFIKNIKK